MTDNYPRVRRDTDAFREPQDSFFIPKTLPATHKVVPIDAIVIERDRVPKVEVGKTMLRAANAVIYRGTPTATLERKAWGYLALLLHQQEAPERALAEVIESKKHLTPRELAHFLLQVGVQMPTDGDPEKDVDL